MKKVLLAGVVLVATSLFANVIPITQTNNSVIGCSQSTPCGTITITPSGGNLDVTVNLTVPYQFDRIGFDGTSGLTLNCFAFAASCTSGVGGASLGGSKQEGPYGLFDYTLYTGLNGGSHCCQSLFSFVLSGSSSLSINDLGTDFAGHVANANSSGFVNGLPGSEVPEPSTFLLLGGGLVAFARKLRC